MIKENITLDWYPIQEFEYPRDQLMLLVKLNDGYTEIINWEEDRFEHLNGDYFDYQGQIEWYAEFPDVGKRLKTSKT